MKIDQLRERLERTETLQGDLDRARAVVDHLLEKTYPEIVVFALVGAETTYGRGIRIQLPSVAHSIVLEAARAQVATILSQFRAIDMEPN